mmetsp:Transcript_46726/g.111133  ORF Transcript_46726/g.111133 Transcript_46726/m.111133 type:complete len:181 (-) Transcript_46726:58-600(-)
MRKGAVALLAGSLCWARALVIQLPSDVGNGEGGNHPCVAVMRETQAACKEFKYGESGNDCNFAVCYTADLNRDRCVDVVTDGTPVNVLFGEDLDKIKDFHDIKCDGGGQGGDGLRNARFDCGNVSPDGLWDGEPAAPSAGPVVFVQRRSPHKFKFQLAQLRKFSSKFPASAESSGLKSCL